MEKRENWHFDTGVFVTRVDKGTKPKIPAPLCCSWWIQCIPSPPAPAWLQSLLSAELREKVNRELLGIDLQWEQEGWSLSAYNSKSMWNTEML